MTIEITNNDHPTHLNKLYAIIISIILGI